MGRKWKNISRSNRVFNQIAILNPVQMMYYILKTLQNDQAFILIETLRVYSIIKTKDQL